MRRGDEEAKAKTETDEEQECVCTPKEKKIEQEKRKRPPCPWDPRFPNANQTKYCYFSFVDWNRCVRLLGLDYQGCELFQVCWQELCPSSWIKNWSEQIDKGAFARPIYPPWEEKPKRRSYSDEV